LNIRLLKESDLGAWHDMRSKLWADQPPDKVETVRLFRKPTYLVWLAETDDGNPIGFLESQTCNRADGCESDAILYIEGWFVDKNFRYQGIGSKLMAAAELWARSHNIEELASDALIDNHASHRLHLKLGFHEVDRQISYAKKLGET